MNQKEYQLLKNYAKHAFKRVKMPYRGYVVFGAYRTSKLIYTGQDRLISFWECLLVNALHAKGWR